MFSKSETKSTATPTPPQANPSRAASSHPSLLAANLRMSGEIALDGDLQVDGEVEGNVSARKLVIGQTGSIKGNITAEDITVAGKADGEIKAKRVVLQDTAQITGNIRYEILGVSEGAVIEGECRKQDWASAAPPAPNKMNGSKSAGGSKAQEADASLAH